MSAASMNLGELLLFKAVASEEQVNKAVALQEKECKGMLLGDVLSSRCDVSRERIEAAFLQNVLLPLANDIFFSTAEEIMREKMPGKSTLSWVMLQPSQCARHCVDSQKMVWNEGAFDLGSRTVTDTLEIEGTLTLHYSDAQEVKLPIRFYYDIRKKAIKAQNKVVEELRKALFRSASPS